MGITFNADEVFAIAERIEENGAAFYRRAAELHGSTEGADTALLLRLAAMEDQHQAVFASMREELPDCMREVTASDPYMEAELYLHAVGNSHGGEGAPEAADALTGKETAEEIIRTAIGLEQKSIAFYVGLRDMVPPKLGQGKVDAIIAEEKDHVTILTAELRAVRGD
jgi:rubrerythrin